MSWVEQRKHSCIPARVVLAGRARCLRLPVVRAYLQHGAGAVDQLAGEGLAAAVRRATALCLGAGETLQAQLCAVLWQGRGPVERVTPDGTS